MITLVWKARFSPAFTLVRLLCSTALCSGPPRQDDSFHTKSRSFRCFGVRCPNGGHFFGVQVPLKGREIRGNCGKSSSFCWKNLENHDFLMGIWPFWCILNGICSGFLLGSSTSFHEKIISQSWNIIHILRGNHNFSSTQELHLTMLTTMCHLDSHGRKFPGQAAMPMLPSQSHMSAYYQGSAKNVHNFTPIWLWVKTLVPRYPRIAGWCLFPPKYGKSVNS